MVRPPSGEFLRTVVETGWVCGIHLVGETIAIGARIYSAATILSSASLTQFRQPYLLNPRLTGQSLDCRWRNWIAPILLAGLRKLRRVELARVYPTFPSTLVQKRRSPFIIRIKQLHVCYATVHQKICHVSTHAVGSVFENTMKTFASQRHTHITAE